MIAADLSPLEVVRVNELNATSFEFLALNESVTSVVVQTFQNTTEYSVSPTTEWTTLDHNMDSETSSSSISTMLEATMSIDGHASSFQA